MVKVTKAMADRWKKEIITRSSTEFKTNILKDIGKRENINCKTVKYWVMPEQYRIERRNYAKTYRQEHPEQCREKVRECWSKSVEEYRKKQREYKIAIRKNPKIREHMSSQKRIYRKVCIYIEDILPQIIPDQVPSASVEEMVDSLYVVTGHSIRPSTLEKSINNYIAHNPAPIIKRVNSKYVRI